MAVLSGLLFAACGGDSPEPSLAQDNVGAEAPLRYVGSKRCAGCHATEVDQWRGSHHQLAMQTADAASVLGDFSDQTISYFGSETTFYQRDNRYFVRTQDSAGADQEYEITHTFGVTPLQQYLVDAAGGRKQALQFAWDARPAEAGGQRWYHLYPDDDLRANDPLHWTGNYFNWNYMCAECHSTDVQLGYDDSTNTFATTFSEISVGCEGCHGPASGHVAQAESSEFDGLYGLAVNLDDRNDSAWVMDVATGIARRSRPATSRQQVESCGRCHSRRTVLTADYEFGEPLTATHMPALLAENLYHADGRILGEVYVYGSFLQSKMYAAGVTCTDCHNPHTGKLHAGPEPNDTCARCHLPTRFAATSHAGPGSVDCVSCHMPATTYMGVDDRRDHSFRLPDTSQANDHYGAVISAGRKGGANRRLLDGVSDSTIPAIARATMLTLLEPDDDTASQSVIAAQLDDSDPLLRIAALRTLRRQPPGPGLQSGSRLLRDPVRGVRIEAAITYAEYRDLLAVADARAFARAAAEYHQALQQAAHMPETALQQADFEARSGNALEAERQFRRALNLDPDFATARHAYGMFLVRTNRHDAALAELAAAARLAPDVDRYAYVYGVALNSLGESAAAIDVLTDARRRFPDNFDIAWGLATMLRDRNDTAAARRMAEEMLQAFPQNEQVRRLLDSIPE